MTKDRASANDLALPSFRLSKSVFKPADLHQRALYLVDAFNLIEECFETKGEGAPIFALVEAFLPIANSVCEDIEKMGLGR